MRKPWLHHAFWNTLEQGFTRIADAFTGFVLIWVLMPEPLGELGLAQAWVAPTLLLFVTPEGALYRDLAGWKREGPDYVASCLRALRLFAWSKVALAIAASLLLATVFPGETGFAERLAAILWAYSFALGPQIAGPDREFLRMELRLRTLNLLSLLQKSILLGGTILVSTIAGGRFAPLAAVAGLAATVSAFVAWRINAVVLRTQGASTEGLRGRRGPPPRETLKRTLLTFTLWQHLSATAATWIRTMDLFFLGQFQIPARVLGLYAAALKVANIATAAPMAAVNLCSIWIGRNDARRSTEERRFVLRMTALLGLGTLLVAIAIALLLPLVLPLLSHGRWTPEEIGRMSGWIHWLLGASIVYATAPLLLTWQALRTSCARLFLEVFVPWTAASLLLFAVAAGLGGADWTARTAVAVSGVGLLLAIHRFRRAR